MPKVRKLVAVCLFVLSFALLAFPARAAETIKIGILHSLSGTMAISETSLKDVALMTIEEINEKGGVLGRKLEPVVVDPASNWPLFAEKAVDLISNQKVAVTFGCWTSVSRKSVLPAFEELNRLRFYPVQYEGEESSFNVFYTGAAPNQQAIPAVEYLMSAKGGGAKRWVLLGTDYVYPRTTNKILRYFLHSKGVKDDDIYEEYTPFGHADYQTIISKIKSFSKGKRTAVVSTINGDSNVPFYKELGNQGIKATDIGIHMWAQAVEQARTTNVDAVRQAVGGQQFRAPSGFTITLDAKNHHLHKPVVIGEVKADGQFKVVWKTDGPIRAQAWSPFIPDSAKKVADWSFPYVCGNCTEPKFAEAAKSLAVIK